MKDYKRLILEKLQYLTDNHVPGYDPDKYGDWIKNGMILHEEGFSVSDWESWSMRSQKYDQKECENHWKTFNKGGGVTGATITNDARLNGWEQRRQDVDEYNKSNLGIEIEGNTDIKSFDSPESKNRKKALTQQSMEENFKLLNHEMINGSIPEAGKQIQTDDMLDYMEAVFKPNDIVNVVTDYTTNKKSDGKTKYNPKGYGNNLKVHDMVEKLKKADSVEEVIGNYNHDVGAWIRINPMDGKGIKNANVSDLRYVLVESDEISTADQVAIMKKLNLPIAALVYSGGKSVHAVVKIDADSKEQYDERVKFLFKVCDDNGLKVDAQCRNESRLSRIAGVDRGCKKQYLMKTNIGARSWVDWKIWVDNSLHSNKLKEYKKNNAVNEEVLEKLKKRIIETNKKPLYKTGFKELDAMLGGGIRAGLYCVGAVPSLGKTTFVLQIADFVASSGLDVLMFSLEMEREELICKSLSRESFFKCRQKYGHSNYAQSTLHFITGRAWDNASEPQMEILQDSFNNYLEKTDGRLFIFEGVGTIGIDDGLYIDRKKGKPIPVKGIATRVNEHKRITGNKPLVVIDYAQILAPFKDEKDMFGKSDKQILDRNILELKRLSRTEDVPIIAISSFNRESYTSPVNMSAFKESGAIEYGSDVLLGLQYKGMDYKKHKDEQGKEYRETKQTHDYRVMNLLEKMEKKAKKGESQPIEIKILKNRNGGRGVINVDFFPMFNTFIDNEQIKTNTKPDNSSTLCKHEIGLEQLKSANRENDDEFESIF